MSSHTQTTGSSEVLYRPSAASRGAVEQDATGHSDVVTEPCRHAGHIYVKAVNRLHDLNPAAAAHAAVPAHQDAPCLPDPVGIQAKPATVLERVKQMSSMQGCSIFAVLQTLFEISQNNQISLRHIKQTRAALRDEAKDNEVRAKRKEIHGNTRSTVLQLSGGIVSFVLSALAAAKFRFQDQAINQFVSGAVNLFDQTVGGRSEANEASVERMGHSNTAQREQSRMELLSATFDKVDDVRKNAQKSLMAYVQMLLEQTKAAWR